MGTTRSSKNRRRNGQPLHTSPDTHHRNRSGVRPAGLSADRRVSVGLSLSGILPLAAISASFVWLAYQIIIDTTGRSLAATNPQAALIWNPGDAIALNALAEKAILGIAQPSPLNGNSQAGPNLKPQPHLDLATGSILAKRSLLSSPLNARALTLLGWVAFQQRDIVRGDELIRLAGARTWRDLFLQTMLFSRLGTLGDYPGALKHIDAIFRAHREMIGHLFPALAAFHTNPAGWRALAELLINEKPWWRPRFLVYLSTELRDRERLVQLYDFLTNSNAPPTSEELKAYLARLIDHGLFDQAYRVWRATLPSYLKSVDGLLFNGDFSRQPDGLQFDWSLVSTEGADIQIADAPSGATGKALQIEFSGARMKFRDSVKHLLVLPAGAYRLTAQVKAGALRTRRGLWWNISCANAANQSIGHTDLVSGSRPWSVLVVDFSVPPQDCGAQWLALELPARFDLETEIEGQVWFSKLKIESRSSGRP